MGTDFMVVAGLLVKALCMTKKTFKISMQCCALYMGLAWYSLKKTAPRYGYLDINVLSFISSQELGSSYYNIL